MRRALLPLLVGAVFAVWPALAAGAPQATCSPESCPTWQTGPVAVDWTDPNPADPSTCDTVISDETSVSDLPLGTPVTCDDGDPSGPVTIYVKIDRTRPLNDGATPGRPPDHAGWYTHPVTFAFNGSDALSGLAGCDAPVYSGPDGNGLKVPGSCRDLAGNATAVQSPAFDYDATPPSVTLAPARAPDFGGWYNHPVAFTPSGADVTSGIASCSGASYAGPDSAHAAVSGSCSDRAGNAASGTASLRYDSTPPARAVVQVTPGNHRVDLSWSPPPDARSVVVLRSAPAAAAPRFVYAGRAGSFVDRGLKNSTRYRYTVTDIDQAGNSSALTVRAVPTASSLRPPAGSAVSAPPRLTWKGVSGAPYYNLQLWRGGRKVLSTWPRRASLQVAGHWRYRGRSHRIAPGHYRWYVWPGIGPKSAHRYGRLIGSSSFRIR